ncbi:hypothetical protein L3556_14410 [Candidatus Synechococcus calcipolaris G9]|uniref:Uncharacterized protein n=1 Tax=Candidatus Synechococcus calcipolaris G9 TaxID=1497997 RepID=A0ABT6F2V2_9SYNE|nr:hypothetical protein [Candidatus Synechococcus calcipolaris]MDG2992113.1 hypothetical protein [Candidatus Synechococcus calcipolaris G9]
MLDFSGKTIAERREMVQAHRKKSIQEALMLPLDESIYEQVEICRLAIAGGGLLTRKAFLKLVHFYGIELINEIESGLIQGDINLIRQNITAIE